VIKAGAGFGADNDFRTELFVQALKAGCQIDRIADQCIGEAFCT
jgi:hypothetical protein